MSLTPNQNSIQFGSSNGSALRAAPITINCNNGFSITPIYSHQKTSNGYQFGGGINTTYNLDKSTTLNFGAERRGGNTNFTAGIGFKF